MGIQRQIETSKIAVDDMFGPGAYERAMNKLNRYEKGGAE